MLEAAQYVSPHNAAPLQLLVIIIVMKLRLPKSASRN
jgi:hypothetical protein